MEDYDHQIKLTNPNLRNYLICARLEKGRIIVYGGLHSHYYQSGKLPQCTVSPNRNATDIAQDIRKKIVITAMDEIRKANDYHQREQESEEKRVWIKGILARKVKLTPCYNVLTGITAGLWYPWHSKRRI